MASWGSSQGVLRVPRRGCWDMLHLQSPLQAKVFEVWLKFQYGVCLGARVSLNMVKTSNSTRDHGCWLEALVVTEKAAQLPASLFSTAHSLVRHSVARFSGNYPFLPTVRNKEMIPKPQAESHGYK